MIHEPPPAATYWFMFALTLAVLLAIVIYDAWAWHTFGRHGTVSSACFALAKQFPIFPLLVGMIIGHLFW